MKRYTSTINPSNPGKKGSKKSGAALSLRAGLAALLLCAGGAMVLPASANSSSATLETAQAPIGAKVIYVNPEKGRDAAGAANSEAAAYRTITYALQQAQSGTVIQLAPGTYSEETGEAFPLTMKSGVTLRGDTSTKGEDIVIKGGGLFVSRTFARQNITINAAANSQIEGVTVTNPNERGTGLWVESTNPVIQNNTFTKSLRDGIFVTGTGNPKIENNVFIKNVGNGISVARAATGEIRANMFQETGFGIAIGDTAEPLVVENTISENTDGIVITNSAQPVLRNNVIEKNTRDGVVAIAQAKPDLGTAENQGNNRIRNNGRHDLYNATANQTLVAIGNDIDAKQIVGRVEFVVSNTLVAFSDIQGNWAQAYIVSLAKKGIIAGFPDGTYRPNAAVTRAEFAAIINKAFTPAAQMTSSSFVDVSSNFWGATAIQAASRGGFLAGYPGGEFRPEQRIPRVQALVALTSGLGLRSDDTKILSRYKDAQEIPDYAMSAVAGATVRELVVNYPEVSELNPNREATRAEVAAFVYQALVNSGKADAIPSPYVVGNR